MPTMTAVPRLRIMSHGHPGGRPAPIRLEREVRAAAGDLLHPLDRGLRARVDGVGGAELPGEVERRVLDVHRHDRRGAGQPGALDDVDADAAAADHGHAVAGADTAR